MKEKIINFSRIFTKKMKVTWPKKKRVKRFNHIVVVTMIIFATVCSILVDKGISGFLKSKYFNDKRCLKI